MTPLNKPQWLAVILAVIFISALVVGGVWYLSKTNERLAALQDRASGTDRNRPQKQDETEPTPVPRPQSPSGAASRCPPRTGDLAPVKPDAFVTRAMFTAMLARLEEADLSGYTASRFNDISEDEWYSASVAWAADKGLVSGIGNGLFDPDTHISRQQAAVILNNYLRYKDRAVTVGATPEITDKSDIGTWALKSVDAVRFTGILPDRHNNRFMPQGKVTNAETDAIFTRLLAFLSEIPIVYPGGQDLDDYGNWLPEYQNPESSALPLYRDEALTIPND